MSDLSKILTLLESAQKVSLTPISKDSSHSEMVSEISAAGQAEILFSRIEKIASAGKALASKFCANAIPREFVEGVIGGVYIKRTSRLSFDTAAWKYSIGKPDHPAFPAKTTMDEATKAYKVFEKVARKDPDYSGYDYGVSIRSVDESDV